MLRSRKNHLSLGLEPTTSFLAVPITTTKVPMHVASHAFLMGENTRLYALIIFASGLNRHRLLVVFGRYKRF